MSTSRAGSTPASSVLRPRAPRLISGLTDPDIDEEYLQPGLTSSYGSPSRSRRPSPSPSGTARRSGSLLRQRPANVSSSDPTKGPSLKARNGSFASIWGTSWSAIQNIASDFLGEQGDTGHSQGRTVGGAKGKLQIKPQASTWGPAADTRLPSVAIAAGSREERDALVRAQKRKDLLSGAAASYPDASGKFKRRTSDEGMSASAPPGANEDRDALVYLHHVRQEDTLAGITIRYSCQANVLRKANRMWPNDAVQVRKILTLPVDACNVKGRPMSDNEVDLMAAAERQDTSLVETPKLNGDIHHYRTESATSNLGEHAPPSVTATSTTDTEPPWTHDSWVLLPNSTKPTEIARLPRRTLGYFPPARRKSQSYSDLDTPSTSLDMSRQAYFDSTSSPSRPDHAPQRPRRPRRVSNATNGYFPSYLIGPGGVGTMNSNVRSPGPAQDGLNKLFANRLPNVAPPAHHQALYMPDVPLYRDDEPAPPATPSGPAPPGIKLEDVGAAVETWIRRLASKAQTALESGGDEAGTRSPARNKAVGGGGAVGDLIEMADGFEVGADSEDDDERGRSEGAVVGGGGTGFMGGAGVGGARSRAKSGKKD